MSVVVADAGPLQYLILIDEVTLLPRLFGTVVLPDAVRRELSAPQTPAKVRAWLAARPAWLEAGRAESTNESFSAKLGEGEQAAIALAIELRASLVLMDDRAGVQEARLRGLKVTGTLGLLLRAARRGDVDLQHAFTQLQTTNFRCSPSLFETTLAAWREERDPSCLRGDSPSSGLITHVSYRKGAFKRPP